MTEAEPKTIRVSFYLSSTVAELLQRHFDKMRQELGLFGASESSLMNLFLNTTLDPSRYHSGAFVAPPQYQNGAATEPPRYHDGTQRVCAHARDLSSSILSCPKGEISENENSRPPKPPPSKSMLIAEIGELREQFEDRDQVDRVLALMAHHLAGKTISFSRRKRLLLEWVAVKNDKGEKWVQAAFDVLLERKAVPRGPEKFLAKLLKDGVNQEATPKQTSIGDPPAWQELRRNYFYCDQTGDWAPKDVRGKPDYKSPRKPHPEGMPRPTPFKGRAWNPRA